MEQIIDAVVERGGAVRDFPFGYLRSAVLSVDGGPAYDVTHRGITAADVVGRFLLPLPHMPHALMTLHTLGDHADTLSR